MPSNTNPPHAHQSDGAQRRLLEFVVWDLGFIWDLVIGIWDFPDAPAA